MWEEAAVTSCTAHGLALLGTWLMTPQVIRPFPVAVSGTRPA